MLTIDENLPDRVSTINFTEDQSKAYTELIDFIRKPFDITDCKRAIIGSAGTGKTFLVRSILRNCGLSYSLIGLSAPTHKACRVLKESIQLNGVSINTLQSDLGLKLNFDIDKFDIKNPPFDNLGRIKIYDFVLYIVDEASMINRDLCMFLENKLKENSIKLIVLGDDAQLCPVNESYSYAFRNAKIHKLTKIIRQGDDNPISELLELLRYDIKHKTTKFLTEISRVPVKYNEDYTKGYQVISGKAFTDKVSEYFRDENLLSNVDFLKLIAYTNVTVTNWNNYIRTCIIKDADKATINKNDLILSYTTIINQFNDYVIKNSEEYILKDVVNYIHPDYELKGFMCRFIAIHGGKVSTPLFIVDHKDIANIQRYVSIVNRLVQNAKNATKTERGRCWKAYYKFKEECLLLTNIRRNDGTIMFGRDLDYGFSLSVYKSQGSTFDSVFVDVNDIVYDKNGNPYSNLEEINRRLYVACSRPKNKLYLRFGI